MLLLAFSKLLLQNLYFAFTEVSHTNHFQISNPTVLEKPGAFMLAPIHRLIDFWLDLTEDQITISYKTYKTDNLADMNEIIDQQLAPGKFCKNRIQNKSLSESTQNLIF